MKVLAFDTAQSPACVAVFDQTKILNQQTSPTRVSHSESLLPLIDQVLKSCGLALVDIDRFCLGVGPGSFTGIRVGVATVRALAQVYPQKKVVALSSLEVAYASHFSESNESQAIVMKAYQQQYFVGYYKDENVAPASKLWHQQLMNKSELAQFAKVYVFGLTPAEQLEWEAQPPAAKVHSILQPTTAEGLLKIYQQNQEKLLSFQEVIANYTRPSQAELNYDKATQYGKN